MPITYVIPSYVSNTPKSMKKLLAFLDTIDKKALTLTVTFVALFLTYLYFNRDKNFVQTLSNLVGASHQKSTNSEIYCSKKGNSNTAYCNDKRADLNEKWNDVVVSNSSNKRGKSAFTLRK